MGLSYRQIKWLILVIPTITIGLWEYVRHEFLLPYISMELGNWLAPVIVFAVTVTFLVKLFSIMEAVQEELNRERAHKAALEERERIAQELHDGIAQSLFLLSVKVDQMKLAGEAQDNLGLLGLQKTVHQVNQYVRQAIANLRFPSKLPSLPWFETIQNMLHDFKAETGLTVEMDWTLGEDKLTSKEKVELSAFVREALLNVRKHAAASRVQVKCKAEGEGWFCRIQDDGIGFDGDPFRHKDRFGLRIVKERSEEMNWQLHLGRQDKYTVIMLRKEGKVKPREPAVSDIDRG
ncbi:sensor histidine kinase [Paenibacillus sp. HJGM_3]|uniref:sensor histidine kinase n=1 Tax=Paenibacillus sp. HJGM_3 TaxID=3379816 RepID=UPI00385A2F85